ncbi:aminoglycoside phosphotransferase family protein [Microbacterium murale]|uniref:Aminoglycoside phosphotransferase n=1 Tax=Microbacterium murale TaxID=1081040 RepID=A0ABQ1RGV4_9MICO|nr:aminoglycoside phosphotransferase family protein [Microbacterium murale]GGD70036.1 aminoglycoside phosphotransferase [Microbacterium murale]
MESRTKNRQDLEAIRAMVQRAYGHAQLLNGEQFAIELTHGWFNAAYKITLRDSRQVVLKVAPSPNTDVMTYERSLMLNELAAMDVLSRRATVRIPSVDFVDTTRTICDGFWFFMHYIEADNFGVLLEAGALSAETKQRLYEQLGTMNRELNGIVGPHFGPIGGPGFFTWREAFLDLVHAALNDGIRARVDLGLAYDTIRSLVIKNSAVLEEVREPRFVSWDLWPSNVMVRDGKIVAAIDHERALYADPLMEAGFLGDELPVFGDSASFQLGYGFSEWSEPEQRRRRLYSLYFALVMTIEPSFRGHQDPKQHAWARERIADIVALLR